MGVVRWGGGDSEGDAVINIFDYLCNCVFSHNYHAIFYIIMDIDAIKSRSPYAILTGVAKRVKERRLELNLTQKAFAKRAGVGYDAYRTFEYTGSVTLRNLVLCAIMLDDTEPLFELFTKKSYQSIDELLKMEAATKRVRGSKNE